MKYIYTFSGRDIKMREQAGLCGGISKLLCCDCDFCGPYPKLAHPILRNKKYGLG